MSLSIAWLALTCLGGLPDGTQHFGYAFCRVPDLDGDRVDDLAISAPAARLGDDGLGAVYLFSTKTFRRIASIPGTGYFGTSLSLIPPTTSWPKGALAITSRCAGMRLVSLHDLQVLWSAEDQCEDTAFSIHTVTLGDVDGDGVADLALARPSARNDERLRCYSGLTGKVLWSALPTSEYAGWNELAATHDRDGDGVNELWLATDRPIDRDHHALDLELVSGRTGASIVRVTLDEDLQADLRSLASVGDVDGDSVDDLLVGIGEDVSGENLHPGWVIAVSGAELVRITRVAGRDQECEFGTCLAVSRLGTSPRWLVAAHDTPFRADKGSVTLFEHLAEEWVARVEGDSRMDGGFAWSAAFLPDLDGDGWEEIAVSDVRGPCGSDAVGAVTIHDGRSLRRLTSIDAP
ncbi:MAG: integrin alpha [Planctomycetes bacterium]|nr:integrin alpha [Planctomycetota bacterium]